MTVIQDQDGVCAVCGDTYYRACRLDHSHSGYCVDIDDTRALVCGHTAHKECQKSGRPCREEHR